MGECILARTSSGGGADEPFVVTSTDSSESTNLFMTTLELSASTSQYVSAGKTKTIIMPMQRSSGNYFYSSTYTIKKAFVAQPQHTYGPVWKFAAELTPDNPVTLECDNGIVVTLILKQGTYSGNSVWIVEMTIVNNTSSNVYYHSPNFKIIVVECE